MSNDLLKRDNVLKIIKYVFSSGSSFAIDLIMFTIFHLLLKNILFATIIARIISSLYNYLLNSRIVFKNYTKSSIFKYYLLVIIQMFVSAGLVSVLDIIFKGTSATVIKFFIDIVIFCVNYVIQKEVVFK